MPSQLEKHFIIFWEECAAEWPVLSSSKKLPNYVFCSVCKCDFSITHWGQNDCLQHVEGACNWANDAVCSTSKNIADMFLGSFKENQNVINVMALSMKFLTEHHREKKKNTGKFAKLLQEKQCKMNFMLWWGRNFFFFSYL